MTNTKKTGNVSQQIVNALKELMKEESFINISVTEVVRKANVARASFYRNFNSTSDVLDALVENLVNRALEIGRPVLNDFSEETWSTFLHEYVNNLFSSKDDYLMMKPENSMLILNRFTSRLKSISGMLNSSSLDEKYNLPARMGAVNGVLMAWYESGEKENPQQIIDYLMSIFFPVK